MDDNEKKQPSQPLDNSCGVCESPASSVFHYGAIVCFSCRSFFRRSVEKRDGYKCRSNSDNCTLTRKTGGKCRKCRHKKCIQVGMNPEHVNRLKNKINAIKDNEIEVEEIKRESIDIKDLAEDCFMEETTKPVDSAIMPRAPVFKLTLEEEFKIHELSVRREFLFDQMFTFILQISTFENWENFLMSICRGQYDPAGKWNIFDRFETDYYTNLKRLNGSPIQASLSMFEGFQDIDEKLKIEMIEFTMPLQIMYIRAILYQHMDKQFFVDQHMASGLWYGGMEEAYSKVFPNNRFALSSTDPIGTFTQFHSPWAATYQDEKFFFDTVKTVGEEMKDDLKLGTLYSTLILSTPGARSSEQAKVVYIVLVF
eukprot:TRINITY_DN9527_c0_g1_i4.p1 TRINITY_DN9527_c0_g1~~TRINITY_DN9527_c0_g1_i4.p1  ORF type:complete len:389 (-),score=81.52 TRINITY_DN9527_c0_g1_i4:750-1853(-)